MPSASLSAALAQSRSRSSSAAHSTAFPMITVSITRNWSNAYWSWHAAHVGVCAWHAWGDVPLDEVFAAMKRGIVAYNEAVGTANTATSGYHETLTRFWAEVIVGHLRAAAPATRLDAVRSAVAAFGAAHALHGAHYSFDVVADRRARAEWVPPDRAPEAQ